MDPIHRLKARIYKRLIIGVILTSATISISISYPLFNNLNKKNVNEYIAMVSSYKTSTDQFLIHIKDVGEQVSSRTRIREMLQRYNKRQIDFQTLKKNSLPLLEDAINSSDILEAVIRFDVKGNPLFLAGHLSDGDDFIKKIKSKRYPKKTIFLDPMEIGKILYIPIVSPILNRNSEVVGWDMVFFNTVSFRKILEDEKNLLGATGEIIPGYSDGIMFRSFSFYEPYSLSLKGGEKVSTYGAIVEQLPVLEENGSLYYVVYSSLYPSGWGMVVKKSKSEIHSEMRHLMLILVFVIALATIAGVSIVSYFIHPLLNHLHEEIELRREAENLLKEKSKELEIVNLNLEKKIEDELMKGRDQEALLAHRSRLATLGDMVGAIAHQWKQPLNTLAISVQDVREAYDSGEVDHDYVNHFVEQALRLIFFMSSSVNDMRRFFRQTSEMTRINIFNTIRDVLGILSGQLQNHYIQVDVLCNEEKNEECHGIFIYGQVGEFQYVLMSLITNAREAIDDKRLKGHMNRTDPGKIVINIIPDFESKRVTITVEDNGTGIQTDDKDKVFDAYFSTRDEHQGTGMGLYIARVILDKMEGRITCEDCVSGAFFRITLPMKVD